MKVRDYWYCTKKSWLQQVAHLLATTATHLV